MGEPCLQWTHLYGGTDGTDNTWVRSICSAVDCEGCERLRQMQLVRRIHKHVNQFESAHWKFVTMSSTNEHYLDTAFGVDHDAWNRLAKNRDAGAWRDVRTYVGWREITWSRKGGFNLHRHLLVLTTEAYWDWTSVHAQWNTANGGVPSNFDVQEMKHGTEAAINYASKYCVKKGEKFYWGGLSREKVRSVSKILYRKHRFVSMKGHKPVLIPNWGYCCDGWPLTCNREDYMGNLQSID